MRLHLTLTVPLLLAGLASCGRPEPVAQDMNADAPAAGAVSVRDSPASDPSLPAAGSVTASPTQAGGGRDNKTSAPLGALTKADESEAMPKAGQANTHSSPSLDAASAPR